jgi:hypothetical protein
MEEEAVVGAAWRSRAGGRKGPVIERAPSRASRSSLANEGFFLFAKEEEEGNIVGGDVVSPIGLRYDRGDGDRGASEMNLPMTEKNNRVIR